MGLAWVTSADARADQRWFPQTAGVKPRPGRQGRKPREKSGRSAHNHSLSILGWKDRLKHHIFRYFFTVFLKCRETAEQPVRGRRGRSRVLGSTHGSHGGD